MIERIRDAGGWRLTYEIVLLLGMTAWLTVTTAADGRHALAPWLIGVTTPVVLVLRLTHPLAAYLGAALAGLATGSQDLLLLTVMSASFGYRTGDRWRLVAGLAGAAACLPLASWWWDGELDVFSAVFLAVLFGLFALLPAGVARLVRRQRTMVAAMHSRNEQLHRQQSEVARRAQARERTRIARDLHDSLGHKLTLISLYAGMPRAAGTDPMEHTDLLRDTASAAMTELRQILGILRQDDEQSAVRPLSGLEELVEGARASGAVVRLQREGEVRPLPALTEHAAYRVIQEGMTNALRHANGGEIVLTLRYEPDALVASVVNTAGRRVVRASSGQGLLGLAERVRVADGVLHYGPTADGGFRLAATLPYASPDVTAEPAATTPGPAAPPAFTGDFAGLMERNRRRNRTVLIATALGVGGLLACCVAGVWLVSALVTVDRATFDRVRVGQSEAEVRAQLPDEEAGELDAPGGRQVPGATCVDYMGSLWEQLTGETGTQTTYRFCYSGGRLVDKQSFVPA